MQRLGRKGHPMYRVVVQDSRQSPDSGKYVALLGNYDPHTKAVNLAKDKAEFYLSNGAQPSERVVKLFKSEKIALPSWVKEPTKQERATRNPEKLRKNRPAEEAAPQTEAEAAEPSAEEAQAAEAPEQAEEAPKPEETAQAETSEEAEPAPAEEAPKPEESAESEASDEAKA